VTLYRLRSLLDNVAHDDTFVDRLPVAWFCWDVNEREDDLDVQASWVAPGYGGVFPHPDCYAAELVAGCLTEREADAIEGYLRRSKRLAPGGVLERQAVTPPLPWRDETGGVFQPIGRLSSHDGGIYVQLFADEGYDLDFRVAGYADVRKGVDRATGKPPLRAWRPSDGPIVGHADA